MIQLAISSWTLHGALGQVWYLPDADGNMVNHSDPHPAALSLLDLPARIAAEGIMLLEICNFHLPSIQDDYLAQLRIAIEAADVALVNLLVDTGNLSSPDDEQWRQDIDMGKRWQDIAVKLGARGVRFDCGTETPTAEAIARSSQALRELADYGRSIGLETTTENWRATSVESANLLEIMRRVGRPLNLCLDFGNAAKTTDKYATMQALLPHATSLHCKGSFDDDRLDVEEFHHSLSLVKAADFEGHIALICDGTDNEWNKVFALKEHVTQQLL